MKKDATINGKIKKHQRTANGRKETRRKEKERRETDKEKEQNNIG